MASRQISYAQFAHMTLTGNGAARSGDPTNIIVWLNLGLDLDNICICLFLNSTGNRALFQGSKFVRKPS